MTRGLRDWCYLLLDGTSLQRARSRAGGQRPPQAILVRAPPPWHARHRESAHLASTAWTASAAASALASLQALSKAASAPIPPAAAKKPRARGDFRRLSRRLARTRTHAPVPGTLGSHAPVASPAMAKVPLFEGRRAGVRALFSFFFLRLRPRTAIVRVRDSTTPSLERTQDDLLRGHPAPPAHVQGWHAGTPLR